MTFGPNFGPFFFWLFVLMIIVMIVIHIKLYISIDIVYYTNDYHYIICIDVDKQYRSTYYVLISLDWVDVKNNFAEWITAEFIISGLQCRMCNANISSLTTGNPCHRYISAELFSKPNPTMLGLKCLPRWLETYSEYWILRYWEDRWCPWSSFVYLGRG